MLFYVDLQAYFSFLGLNLLEYFSVPKEKHQSRDRSAGEIPFTIVMHQ